MPPSKNNSKKEAGRAKKADNEAKKQADSNKKKEAAEADKWKQGSKGLSKGDVEAVKKADLAAKKAERAALLAAEEASLPSKAKGAPKAGQKKTATNLTPALRAGNAGAAAMRTDDPLGIRRDEERPVTELSATGLDEMLDALELAHAKTDDSTMGAKASQIERHPERRFKAAFEAYLDRELPKLKDDHPGLRQNQMRDILFKQFQKAPENPFNQATLAYNATKDERVDALRQNMKAREEKYRVNNE